MDKESAKNIRIINRHPVFYLKEIGEPKDTCLRLVIEGAEADKDELKENSINHFSIVCLNHIIDIATHGEPNIKIINGPNDSIERMLCVNKK